MLASLAWRDGLRLLGVGEDGVGSGRVDEGGEIEAIYIVQYCDRPIVDGSRHRSPADGNGAVTTDASECCCVHIPGMYSMGSPRI